MSRAQKFAILFCKNLRERGIDMGDVHCPTCGEYNGVSDRNADRTGVSCKGKGCGRLHPILPQWQGYLSGLPPHELVIAVLIEHWFLNRCDCGNYGNCWDLYLDKHSLNGRREIIREVRRQTQKQFTGQSEEKAEEKTDMAEKGVDIPLADEVGKDNFAIIRGIIKGKLKIQKPPSKFVGKLARKKQLKFHTRNPVKPIHFSDILGFNHREEVLNKRLKELGISLEDFAKLFGLELSHCVNKSDYMGILWDKTYNEPRSTRVTPSDDYFIDIISDIDDDLGEALANLLASGKCDGYDGVCERCWPIFDQFVRSAKHSLQMNERFAQNNLARVLEQHVKDAPDFGGYDSKGLLKFTKQERGFLEVYVERIIAEVEKALGPIQSWERDGELKLYELTKEIELHDLEEFLNLYAEYLDNAVPDRINYQKFIKETLGPIKGFNPTNHAVLSKYQELQDDFLHDQPGSMAEAEEFEGFERAITWEMIEQLLREDEGQRRLALETEMDGMINDSTELWKEDTYAQVDNRKIIQWLVKYWRQVEPEIINCRESVFDKIIGNVVEIPGEKKPDLGWSTRTLCDCCNGPYTGGFINHYVKRGPEEHVTQEDAFYSGKGHLEALVLCGKCRVQFDSLPSHDSMCLCIPENRVPSFNQVVRLAKEKYGIDVVNWGCNRGGSPVNSPYHVNKAWLATSFWELSLEEMCEKIASIVSSSLLVDPKTGVSYKGRSFHFSGSWGKHIPIAFIMGVREQSCECPDCDGNSQDLTSIISDGKTQFYCSNCLEGAVPTSIGDV